jgi:hypothetical protein
VRLPSLVGLPAESHEYYAQGMWKNGRNITWMGSKRYLPLPLHEVEFSGGYPNDDGVNLMHDVSPAGALAPETRALLALVQEEIIDGCLNMHGWPMSPLLLPHASHAPPEYGAHNLQLAERVHGRLQAEGLRPGPIVPGLDLARGSFNLPSAMHHTSGCLSVCFETAHGLSEDPYSYEELLDMQLLVFEETMRFGVQCRFRPEVR